MKAIESPLEPTRLLAAETVPTNPVVPFAHVAAPALTGKVVTTPLTHHSLTGLYTDVIGIPRLRSAADAPPFATAFGLTVGPD